MSAWNAFQYIGFDVKLGCGPVKPEKSSKSGSITLKNFAEIYERINS